MTLIRLDAALKGIHTHQFDTQDAPYRVSIMALMRLDIALLRGYSHTSLTHNMLHTECTLMAMLYKVHCF